MTLLLASRRASSLDPPITDHILHAGVEAVPQATGKKAEMHMCTKANMWAESYASGHIHYTWLMNRMKAAFDFLRLLIREVLT